jgi:hypothetical protein
MAKSLVGLDELFKGRHFEREIIVLCVRWYLRFKLCFRDLVEMMAERGLSLAHTDVVQAPNDKQQIEPMLEQISALPDALGKAETLLADTGYFSAGNVTACMAAGIEPLIAIGRQPHHPPLSERFAQASKAPQNPTPVQAMAHRPNTPQGRKLYALRKQIPEPVFGIVKSVIGFRQFMLRGIDNVRSEWNLVTMAWNVKRMFILSTHQ